MLWPMRYLARVAPNRCQPVGTTIADVEQKMRKTILRTAAYILLFICLFGNVRSCYPETNRGWKKKWILVAVALTAANVLNAYSSQGGNALNPLLRGPDRNCSARKAVVVKSAASGEFLTIADDTDQENVRPKPLQALRHCHRGRAYRNDRHP